MPKLKETPLPAWMKNCVKLIKNKPWIALAIALVLLPSSYFSNYYSREEADRKFWTIVWDIAGSIATEIFCVTIVFMLAVVLFRKFEEEEKENDQNDLIQDIRLTVLEQSNKLEHVSTKLGLTLAIHFLKTAESCIKVVGIAKDELSEDPEYREILKEYRVLTENRLEEADICYQRITDIHASHPLKNHLKTCLYNAAGKAQIIFLDDYAVANTFLIIDDKFLFISPTATKENIDIGRGSHITVEKKIINNYINHFDDLFKKAEVKTPVFRSSGDFEDKFEILLGITNRQRQIAEGVHSFIKEKKSWKLDYSNKFLEDIERRVQLLNGPEIKLKHKQTFHGLHSLASSFLDRLNPEDSYHTITFAEFWQDVPQEFLDSNLKAISRNALLQRMLIIDCAKIGNPSYMKALDQAFEINLGWVNQVGAERYHFRMLFLEDVFPAQEGESGTGDI